MKICTLLIAILLLTSSLQAQFPAACDKDKSCNNSPALTLTQFSDKGTHYAEVNRYSIRDKSQTALTFESWINLTRVSGKQQFIAGLWGPSFDVNDVWVVYIAPNNDIVFELNGDGTKLKSNDNTVVRFPFSQYFGKWTHIAAVFDGAAQSATLFVNGISVVTATNSQYPTRYLRPTDEPKQSKVPLQIGSCNGLSDNKNLFENFKGQMDEIKVWTRPLTAPELVCQKDRELNGNEAGLLFYYRCNEGGGSITLCDATGRGYTGDMKSGASCQKSNRTVPQSLLASVSTITQTIKCISSTTFDITIQDTSLCGSDVTMRVVNDDSIGAARPMTITGYSVYFPQIFQIVSPATFPVTIPAGGCLDLKIRFVSKDTTRTYFDTLKIQSDERCPGVVVVEIKGVVQDVIDLPSDLTRPRLRSVKFPTICVGQLSDPVAWTWQNRSSRLVTVDSIIIPPGFTNTRLRFPFLMPSKTGLQTNYFRFFPNRSGLFNDTVIIKARIQGSSCTIIKKIAVSGTGYEAKVEWLTPLADFGNVIVGQEKLLP
ncbi:MAG: LamG domain-containing protein [Ignavibacteria bacterium]|nr:LamG domain-containing protein [Ignavibacteria bacterium]